MEASVYNDAIVIDAVCPILHQPKFVDLYRDGGVTVCAPTMAAGGASGNALSALSRIGQWTRLIHERDDLMMIRTAADIRRAKAERKLGILFHFQGTDPIENDVDLIDAFWSAGVRMIQLTYNVRNRVGDGCAERTDSGLSIFGQRVVKRLNERKVVVDCSHTGRRTTLEAIEASSAPVVISHGNPSGVVASPRNISDEEIKAIAASGGLIGANGFPPFVANQPRPTLDQLIDHIAYMCDLVGSDHVGLGLDYYDGCHPFASDDKAQAIYKDHLQNGRWSASTYPSPPWHMPEGIATPKELPNLGTRLLERGFSADDTTKILGGNWVRVFEQVWGA